MLSAVEASDRASEDIAAPPDWAEATIRELTRGRVLDIGCGEGRFLPRGGIGVDLDRSRVLAARERSHLVAVADAHQLPFADATFDTAYANRMLNDAGGIDDVLREIRRVLRPGGRLLVYTRARAGGGDRLDAGTGELRLRVRFPSVRRLRDPGDARGAIFAAERDAHGPGGPIVGQ
ncbi:hypothetical protein BH18CHL2_BH18CHL2_06970 [soil metagenome]